MSRIVGLIPSRYACSPSFITLPFTTPFKMSDDSQQNLEVPFRETEENQQASHDSYDTTTEERNRASARTPRKIKTPGTILRINRFLASVGLGSRRSCEEHIIEGRVSINGSVCRNLATKVNPDDDVRLNGKQIHQAPLRYFLLHKPAGYVSTRSDIHAARTIFDLLPAEASNLFHVGRLDKESEGLLLLTNDGIFAQNLLHPSRGVEKEYEVTVDQPFTPKAGAALKKGTWIEGAVARVESVYQLNPYKIKLVLHQGIKRQIRVMLGQLGFEVKKLVRVRIGPIKIQGLASGHYRQLRPQELEALRAASLSPRPKKEKVAPVATALHKLLGRSANHPIHKRSVTAESSSRFTNSSSPSAARRSRTTAGRPSSFKKDRRGPGRNSASEERPSFSASRKQSGRPSTGSQKTGTPRYPSNRSHSKKTRSPRFSNR